MFLNSLRVGVSTFLSQYLHPRYFLTSIQNSSCWKLSPSSLGEQLFAVSSSIMNDWEELFRSLPSLSPNYIPFQILPFSAPLVMSSIGLFFFSYFFNPSNSYTSPSVFPSDYISIHFFRLIVPSLMVQISKFLHSPFLCFLLLQIFLRLQILKFNFISSLRLLAFSVGFILSGNQQGPLCGRAPGKVREPAGLTEAPLVLRARAHHPVCENPREKIIPLLL